MVLRESKSPSKNRVKITLADKLDEIYNSTVCLDTTCKGSILCCKTACPQMNFSEYSALIHEIWNSISKSEKLDMICKSIEYFFKNDFSKFKQEIFIKPCMLLSKEGKCRWYEQRCLSCRMFGIWPESIYTSRVDKFEKAYAGLLKREELPLNKQCPYVKRVDDSVPLTNEVINSLYKQLDELDKKVGNFSDLQVEQKENYRTFHDWLLYSTFGEQWLIDLTNFAISASKEIIEDQMCATKKAIVDVFSKDMPDLGK